MRIVVTFESENKIKLPIHYNHIIQHLIYSNISNDLANFLHEKGYLYGKRVFKLFTFSKIYGKYNIIKNFIEFTPPIKIYISSVINQFIDEIADNFMRNERIKLVNKILYLVLLK